MEIQGQSPLCLRVNPSLQNWGNPFPVSIRLLFFYWKCDRSDLFSFNGCNLILTIVNFYVTHHHVNLLLIYYRIEPAYTAYHVVCCYTFESCNDVVRNFFTLTLQLFLTFFRYFSFRHHRITLGFMSKMARKYCEKLQSSPFSTNIAVFSWCNGSKFNEDI